MIPLRDTVPSSRTAWVTRALLIGNIVAFALELRQGPRLDAFIDRFGVVPHRWFITSLSELLA